jgi:hypothetical protein
MPPKMLGIKQKALSYMPHGKDMTMSSALIYIYTIVSKFDANKNKIQYKFIKPRDGTQALTKGLDFLESGMTIRAKAQVEI